MERILMSTKRQDTTESNQPAPRNNGGVYEIKIKGLLDDHWQQWFEGMTLNRQENVEGGQDCTLLIGPIADQPALHGLLAKIRDLNLILISVREIPSQDLAGQERDQTDGQSD
jgi:hypothetical protein